MTTTILQRHRTSFDTKLLTHDEFIAFLRQCARAWANLGSAEQHDAITKKANEYEAYGQDNCPVCQASLVD